MIGLLLPLLLLLSVRYLLKKACFFWISVNRTGMDCCSWVVRSASVIDSGQLSTRDWVLVCNKTGKIGFKKGTKSIRLPRTSQLNKREVVCF